MLNLKKMLTKVCNLLTTKTGTMTAFSGFTLSEIQVKQYGNVVNIKGYATKSGNLGEGNITIGTVSGVSLPPQTVRFTCSTGTAAWNAKNSAYGLINTGGNLVVEVSNTANSTVIFSVTYII